MAWFQVSYYSQCLQRLVPLNVLLPQSAAPEDPCRTLYLLNGYRGDHTDWLLNTDVNGMSGTYRCAVVMPGGENSSYVDQPGSGVRYGEFVGRELVDFTRRLFPCLSQKREDTAIAGLSMGGYGALRNGLKYHETFGFVLPLSAGMMGPESIVDEPSRARFEARYGLPEGWEGSDCNPRALAKRLIASGAELPKLYIACGWNDRLCVSNREYHHDLEALGFPHTYEEGPGSHEWATWRWALPRALDFCGWRTPDTFVNPFYCELRDEKYAAAPWKEEC
jgi:S-formylglutathione hydrolase FrmB